jgi:mRNA interferase MazF
VKRGDIFWADLAPRSGSEQTGRRPVIILSHDAFNQTAGWRSIIVVPVSTSPRQARRGPTVVPLAPGTGGLPVDSMAICHQITTLDRAKLAEQIGHLPQKQLVAVEQALLTAVDIRQ